eukprot:g61674.t1
MMFGKGSRAALLLLFLALVVQGDVKLVVTAPESLMVQFPGGLVEHTAAMFGSPLYFKSMSA